MGQSTPGKLAPADVRERVKGLRLDDVLGDEALLKQATSGSTCAYQRYRFTPVSGRSGSRHTCLAGMKFWHLGSVVSLESATAEFEPGAEDAGPGILSAEGSDHAFGDGDGEEEEEKKTLIIRFEQATAVTEFAFRTAINESREKDPVRFKLEGSSSGQNWLTLCDQTEADFATPNGRGSWTQKIPLRDMTVSPDHVEMQAARNLASVMERRGVEDLALWASDKPPRAPVDEAAALVECCRVQLTGEKQRRREELFSMLHTASEAAVVAAKEAEYRSTRKTQSKPAEVGSGIAALTARCAVHLILESQLQGSQSGLALDLLNRHLMDGVANLRLPPKAGDIPEALNAALTSAAEICRNALSARLDSMERTLAGSPAATAKALRSKNEQGPKVAELLLRLAALRGSFGDALVVARWLLCEQPDGDLSSLCPAVKVLDEIHASWQMESFKEEEGAWTTDDVPARKAVRSKACLSPAQLQSCGSEGVYAEAHLIAGTECRVGFLPCSAKSPDDTGVGFQAGKAYLEGDLRPLEGSNSSKILKSGDTIGLWLRSGQGVEVFVNGTAWGRLPKLGELESSGCFFAVASLAKEDEVALNVGQSPFRYSPPSDSTSFARAAGVEFFNSAASSSSDALALSLLSILQRNAALVPEDVAASGQTKTYESKHPYENYMDELVEVHIPGASSMKIVFDKRCRTESGCDFLRFWADANKTKQIGQDFHDQNFPDIEIEGDKFWYHFTSDSSQVEWGFKFTLEPEMPGRGNEFPLCLEPTVDTVTTFIDILQQPRVLDLPKASSAVLNMVPMHVNRVPNLPSQVQRDAADLLLRLAREQSEVGAISAHIFGDCCSTLFQQPVQLMRAQLRIWREPDGYHPDAVAIVSDKIASSRSPVGSLVDDTAASAVFDEFVAAVAGEASILRHPAPAARLLWRTLSESVSYLIAERSQKPLDGWALVLKAVKRIFELGAATAASLIDIAIPPPGFLRSLLLPLLYGMAAVPSLQDAPWDDVVTLIPPIGILARTCGAAAAPPFFRDLQSAALALLAKLGRAIIGVGRLVKSDEANAEVLLSPLLCIVPGGALGKDYGGPPTGVFMVEQVTGAKLQCAEDVGGESMNPLLAEVVELESERAKSTVESLSTANKGRAFFPERIRRLLFCVLVKQFRALDSLQLVLESSGGGDVSSDSAIQNCWMQAQRLEPWLLSVKQRLTGSGRDGKSVVEAMEQTLELLVRCNQIVELDGAVDGDDDGLEALWARQMPLMGGKPQTPKSPSLQWGSQTPEPPPLQRLHSLMQAVPLPGANVPAQHVKTFFEGKWFTKSSPLATLVRGIQEASIAVWRRAAGLSLLAWAAEQCAESAEGWAVGSVLSALCESWREESSLPRRCAEASSVRALALSRQQAVKAMARLAQGSVEGEQGQVLQVMALAGLAGPWRGDDHDIVLRAEVVSTLRPHLPWAQGGKKQHGRASWLAFESITSALAPVSELVLQEVSTMLEQALPEVICKAKRPEPKEGESKPAEAEGNTAGEKLSLLDLFGAKVVHTSRQSGESSGDSARPRLTEIIADLRRRLQAGEDFGGLESDTERWSSWLERLPSVLDRWEDNEGRRTIEQLEAENSSDSDDDERIPWRSHDVDSDGSIDIYEVLRVLQGVARRHPDESDFRNWPSRLPAGLPRFFGDISLAATGPSSKSTPLDLVPSPVCIRNPGCALLKSIDGLLRAQPSRSQAIFYGDEFLEALLQAATDPSHPLPMALLALRLLRNIQLPSAERETAAARTMLQALSASNAGGPLYARGPSASLMAHRAELLRAWISTGRAVADAFTEALSDPAQAAAALYVVGAPPALYLLGSALADGENHCLVVDSEFGGVTWTFHPRRDSPGYDIECSEDDLNPEFLKKRCVELGGVAFNTNGWIKRELRAEGEWDTFGDESEGMYVANRDDSVAIFRDGNSAVEEVAVASLKLLSRRCNMSKIGSALEKRIVDVALQQPCLEAWSLGAALAQPDAALHFVAEGGMEKWLPLALDAPLKKLVPFSPADRSRITAALRMQFPGKYKDAVDACGTGAADAAAEPAVELKAPAEEKPEAQEDAPPPPALDLDDLGEEMPMAVPMAMVAEAVPMAVAVEAVPIAVAVEAVPMTEEDCLRRSTADSESEKAPSETESEPAEPGGRCDSGAHVCVLSDSCPGAYRSYVCNACGGHKSGNRWYCAECSNDYCFDCRPFRNPNKKSKEQQDAERAKKKAALAVAGAAAVRRATRVLGEPDALSMPASPEAGVPKLDALLAYAHAVLSHPPALRVLRLHALQDEGAGGTRSGTAKSKCGLIDSVEQSEKSSSSTKEIHKLLWAARSNEKELSELVVEAVAWDRQVLALEICHAVVLHFAGSKEPLPERLGQPLQLAQLCLAYESNLDNVPERARAKTALSNLTARLPSLSLAVQELAFSHLVGCLGLLPSTSSSVKTYESGHPYGNNEDTSTEVVMPGASRIVISFDRRCSTEEGCDRLCFEAGAARYQRDGDGPWSDIVIEQDNFKFNWHSDGSCTDWGYHFTATPDNCNDDEADVKGTPRLSDGLMLLEFLVDLLPPPESKPLGLDARALLRQEFAALLLAHVERSSSERLVVLLQRFIDGCKRQGIALDWLNAQHALEAMTTAAQESGEQAVLQRCVGLRLSLPDVKVATEQPRFATTNRVLLLDEDRVCTARTRREAFCQVLAGTSTTLTFTRLTEKQTWVGALYATQPPVQPVNVCMFNLNDGSTLVNSAVERPDAAMLPDSLREVRVLLDAYAGSVTFEGDSFSRPLKLPSPPDGNKGCWVFAAKLGEFGSSVRVTPPGGISNSSLQQLRATEEVLGAIRGIGSAALSDAFLIEAFSDWWSNCSTELRPDVEDVDLDSLEKDDLVVCRAGISKCNGKYQHKGNQTWKNEAGCRIYHRITDEGVHWWGMDDRGEEGEEVALALPVYASRHVDPPGDPSMAPWMSLEAEAGEPPRVHNREGTSKFKVMQEFLPPLVSAGAAAEGKADPAAGKVLATQIIMTPRFTFVFLLAESEESFSTCKPSLLYTERDGEPKPVADSSCGSLGKAGCLVAPTSEWSLCQSPALHFQGGPSHSIEELYRGVPGAAASGRLAKLYPKLAVTGESVHPLPIGGNTSLKLSIPDAIGITLQFSTRCQLPPDRVVLVSLDEAGQRPAVLKRRTAAADPMLAASQPGMEQDAARGIIAVPKGLSFKLDAPECFLRFPLPRPVQWEPLALPVPVVEQSAHPYGENLSVSGKVCVPGAQTLRVDFHTSCCTEGGYDNLRFFRDEDLEMLVHSCSGEGPWEGFEFTHGNTLWWSFSSDEGNEYWGYHFTVSDAGGDGGVRPGIGLLEGIPTLFDDGVQLGGDGTLLFVGLTSPEDFGNLRPVTTAKADITNFVVHEGYCYGTLDNVEPDAESEKGSQSEWFALPQGWLLAPNESTVIEEVVAAHAWATDTLILEDGTAFGTKCFQERGRAWRSQALEATISVDGQKAFKARSDLARILVRRPRAEDESVPLLLDAEEIPEEIEVGYIVRHSLSAMNWLRPGVLAGELTIDFTGAPITSGDLAIGITPGPQASLMWKSDEMPASPRVEEPEEKPVIQVTCDEGHPLDDLGTTMDNGWGCDGANWPDGCRSGFTGFGQTTGVNRFRCVMCDYDICEKCYRYKKGMLSDEQQPEDSPGNAPSWWWRCDGAQLSCGKASGSDPGASFGAGDVVGMVATLEGPRLVRLAFLRNGIAVAELNTDVELLDADAGKLALCLALRRSSVCTSLLPSPKLIEQLPPALADGSGEEKPLDEREQAVAIAVFKAMDVSADGALQREEITTALGGSREEVFQALDTSKDGKVSPDEWLLYCRRVKSVKGPNGIGLFLEAFRKKLVHIGRVVAVPEVEAQAIEAWGVEVTATPRELTTSGTLRAVQEGASSDWTEFRCLAIESWTYGLDSQVVALAEWLVQQLKSKDDDDSASDVNSPTDLRPVHVQKFRGERRRAFPTLTESESRIISRLVVLQQVNRWVKDRLLPFCDLGDMRSSSFARCASQARDLLFGKVGRDRFEQIVQETFTDAEGEMRLKRQLAIECKTANGCDSAGDKMLFAQGSKLAEGMGDAVFRSRGGEYGRPLRITYEDEEGVDQGGLYRDFLDACATELMSSQLPLLIPTPNATNNAGECREAWMVAPAPMTKATKRMLIFLGRLMGICVRRGDVMPLSLSRTAWKLLVGDEPTLEDLFCDDVAAGESVKQLANIEAMGISAADFDLCFGEMFFVYNNSAREEVPLMQGGAQTRVTYENAGKFAQLVQEMRLHEASEQIECIRTGMAAVVPIGCFSLWSWRELELRVCGNPEIDLKVLRKHSHYEDLRESDAHVQYLWEVLESFGQQDLQRFLRFCWGRARLPPEGSPLWENGFKIANGSDISPNGLPRAHTCFFQIDLPRYESKQKAEERILFAIRNCVDLQIA